MALVFRMEANQMTEIARGRQSSKYIKEGIVQNAVGIYAVGGFDFNGGQGVSIIALYDKDGNKIKEVHGSESNPSSWRLSAAVLFADNSAGVGIDMDLDEATYAAGSKIVLTFAGASMSTPSLLGVTLQYGIETRDYTIRGIEGNGTIEFTMPFKVYTAV